MARYIVFLLTFFLFLTSPSIFAQEARLVDSMKKELSKATKMEDKIKLLDMISRTLMSGSLEEADKYGKELIQVAEKSRDREAMVKAYLSNGVRCGYWAGNRDYTARAMEYFEKAKKIATENKLYKFQVSVLLKQSTLQLGVPNNEKATGYLDQAVSIASTINDDSIQVLIKHVSGDVDMAKNEKIEALRSYLSALRLAEKIKNPLLERESYQKLSRFYISIEDYERAIDYYTMGYKKLDEIKISNVPYLRVTDINSLGGLYALKKNYELAIQHYEESLQMADSLKYANLKMPVYVSLLNVYIMMKEPHKSMEFMESESGDKLKKYFAGVGMSPVMDQAYAIIYSEMGKLDSAGKYFERSAPFFANSQNLVAKMNNYLQTAYYYKRKGENQKAIEMLLNVKEFAEKNGQLEAALEVTKNLDTLYSITGNYQQSKFFSAAYYQYKDSIQTINKEKELAQVEAQDEQARQLKAAEEAAEKKRQRNNIQYLGITIGIVTLFLLMVLFGMFRVSAGTIKMVGFFAFLMFFEFIFLIFKKNIYAITHGEPWIDLLFMIGLAAILLPLHHWLEHKVLHYLTTQNKLTAAGSALRSRFLRRQNELLE